MLFTSRPKIVIKHNKFLDPIFVEYAKKHGNKTWRDWTPSDKKELVSRIKDFQNAWHAQEKVIVKSLQKILGLKFRSNIINVHVVSGNPRDFSSPIIIGSQHKPEVFVQNLTHELIHKLLQENNHIASWNCVSWVSEKFPKEDGTTQNHLIVNAVLKYLYIDILKKPELLGDSISRSKKQHNKSYLSAWEIISDYGYREFISDYKKRYSTG